MEGIKQARRAAGLTQAELARRAGVARPNLAAIESGKRPCSPQMRDQLLDAIGRPSVTMRQHRDEIVALVEASGGANPRIFGSVARGQDTFHSDLDLLVDYVGGQVSSFVALPRRLSELLGCAVDVVTTGGLRPTDRHIIDQAVPL